RARRPRRSWVGSSSSCRSRGVRASGPDLGAIDVAVLHLDPARPELTSHPRDLVGDHDGAVPPAGAAKGEAETGLLLALVARERELQEWDDVSEELFRRGVIEDIRATGLVATR